MQQLFTAQRDGRIFMLTEPTLQQALLEVGGSLDKIQGNYKLILDGRTVRTKGWTFKKIVVEDAVKSETTLPEAPPEVCHVI